mmetsp:Transcript_30482/g.90464  ORF Transcript_30482/g.90464 Transcript_30482/m.90464 type:complete len:294 (-) Transcript_30482:40-921(-)
MPYFLAIWRISRCSSDSSTFSLKPCWANHCANSSKSRDLSPSVSRDLKVWSKKPSASSLGSDTEDRRHRTWRNPSPLSTPVAIGLKVSSGASLSLGVARPAKTSYACFITSMGIFSRTQSSLRWPYGRSRWSIGFAATFCFESALFEPAAGLSEKPSERFWPAGELARGPTERCSLLTWGSCSALCPTTDFLLARSRPFLLDPMLFRMASASGARFLRRIAGSGGWRDATRSRCERALVTGLSFSRSDFSRTTDCCRLIGSLSIPETAFVTCLDPRYVLSVGTLRTLLMREVS